MAHGENRAMVRRNPAARLSDDLIVEILSRLPVRSVCRFKAVCRSWHNLIADRDNNRKLPQTLSGFLYTSFREDRIPNTAHHFADLTGKGMPLTCPSSFSLVDFCNGLLLCRCFQAGPCYSDGSRPFHCLVANPLTTEWVILPDACWDNDESRICLAFDPAVSPQFHVLEYVEGEGDGCVIAVQIYSSETGLWSVHESQWSDHVIARQCAGSRSVFLHGFLHSVAPTGEVLAVDMEGKKWREIHMPEPDDIYSIIHQTQGNLCAITVDPVDETKLSIWILEDYDTDNWILKHTVSTLRLFGGMGYHFDYNYHVIAVQPECNLLFFVYGQNNTLMSYEMDRNQLLGANEVVAVDMEGKKWRTFPMPVSDGDGIIHQTQGCLCAFVVDPDDGFKLTIWILEDYDTDNWILKHTVGTLRLFGGKKYRFGFDYQIIAVHPECNLVFFVYVWDNTLVAYEMDRKEVRVICDLGHDSSQPYLPYVPHFSGSLADGR
uniref:F-box domain-containing protein n=1 Tax=Leersia perrieri TaxID=77586 RepID=A0A0D9WZU3_9ORYZ